MVLRPRGSLFARRFTFARPAGAASMFGPAEKSPAPAHVGRRLRGLAIVTSVAVTLSLGGFVAEAQSPAEKPLLPPGQTTAQPSNPPLIGTPAAAAAAALPTIRPTDPPFLEPLIKRMTLTEKIGQLNLVSRGEPIAGQLERIRRGEIGLMLNVVHPSEVRAYQAAAASSRLAIPLIMGLDAINVFRVAMPQPIALAATWNPAVVEAAAEAVARETAANGINWTFAPMVDVSRDPRWGRVIEGAGEDPVLGAAMAAARVRGYRKGGLATAVKHFVGYGAPEAGRDYNGATIPTSELFDRYLPPFRAALDAGAETVMAAFNTVNGVPVSADRSLLTDLLRTRWKFDGFVTSDYNAIGELMNHGVAADLAAATTKAMNAGIDVDMEGAAYERHLTSELAAGRVTMAQIDDAVRRVLRIKDRMGLFDRDQPAAVPTPDEEDIRRAARDAARQALVLVKNDNDVLPIAPAVRRIALVGAWAESDYDLSWWGPAGLPRPATETLLAAFRSALRPGQTLTYARGFADTCGFAPGDTAAAVSTARQSDVVVLVVNEDCDITGEGTSRAYLGLSGAQQGLLEALSAAGKPIILVVNTGRPLALTAAERLSAAVLIAWHGGTEGRSAIAEALTGAFSPSGKLPMTFPRSVGQIPIAHDGLPTSRPPGADRYTSRYLDEAVTPLYPFGHGLSYARFAYAALEIKTPAVDAANGTLELTVDVTNTGARPAQEVVQVYVRQRVASRSRPLRQLKGFEKVRINPGEVRRVAFRISSAELGYHDDSGRLIVEPGPFDVFVGGSSTTTLSAPFSVTRAPPRAN